MTRCAFLIPTAAPTLAGECFAAWQAMGWDTFAVVAGPDDVANATGIFRVDTYLGWGGTFNRFAPELAGYDWIATGGDDCFPDPHYTADDIGRELFARFGGTFGVAQATGDGWAWNKDGMAEPIAFAPFIGREFAARWNRGRGAFWPGYHHWYADNELRETAHAAGRLWENPDWTVEHRHVAKTGKPAPAYKTRIADRWQGDADLFKTRKATGFPDHAPLPRS